MQPNNQISQVFCTNKNCKYFSSPFFLEETMRCKECNEPAQLNDIISPTINNVDGSIYEKFFNETITSRLGINRNIFIEASLPIGNTPLVQNKKISEWAGVSNLYLKDETVNPTGSFKERGTWTALALHLEKDLILGTVSTGNMATSTAWIIDYVHELLPELSLKSFIVVDQGISQNKLDLIQKAAGKKGTTIFLVKGNYALIHDIVYKTTAEMRKQNRKIYAELTDDVFRITGYSTLFTEIIDQLKLNKIPDYVIVPVASGGLFRVAVWTFEQLKKQGIISTVPKVVLVQEKGADPIVQAFENGKETSEPIKMENNLVAKAIDVSNSRSGTASLSILKEGYHLCTSVTAEEILFARDLLKEQEIFVEEAGAVSLAAAKKLGKEGIIKPTDVVATILSGAEPSKRTLYKQPIYKNTLIHCNLDQLPDHLRSL